MSIAGHVSIEMLRHYSHIRQEAKRKAVASLDNVTIASQLEKWKKCASIPVRHHRRELMRAVLSPSHFFVESEKQCLNVKDADMFICS
jgi:hypothetical protein